jgi:myo-inositol 2-dehydrogenase/D-chiro-inositol 1-dehydrogenase
MSDLKIGLMGCGRIAELVHLPILTHLPDVELVALAEVDPGRLEKTNHLVPKAITFDNYEKLLEMKEVEAVVICLPNALHAKATITALEQGKHVYLEKPLATSLDDARKVLEAWKHSGKIGMMGYNYRFNELYQVTKQHLQAGRLGKLVGARSIFSTTGENLADWLQTRLTGGGVLLDLASHHIDLIRFFFGQEVREVFASVRSLHGEDDSAMLQLKLSNDLIVQSFFSKRSIPEERFEVYGQTGKLFVDRYLSLNVEINGPTLDFIRLRRLWHELKAFAHIPYLLNKIRTPVYEPSYREAMAYFVTAIRTHRPATPDFYDGYRSLMIIEAAEESARTGRTVLIPDLAMEGTAPSVMMKG